jgi:protein-disulfide isomerase
MTGFLHGVRFAVLALLAMAFTAMPPAFAAEPDSLTQALLHDPASPTSGNPNGNLTIVAFFDYNCPYCKKSMPDLEKVAAEDGQIKVIYKDWPILKASSKDAATLALAASYQGKYHAAHVALLQMPNWAMDPGGMRDALQSAGVDLAKLDEDLKAHATDIQAELDRTAAEADALQLFGTPSYVVGHMIESALDYKAFKAVIAEERGKRSKAQ